MKGNLALSLETSDEIAQFAATSMINLGRIRPLSEILEGIEAVSADDIERVARDILRTEKLNFAVLGPHLDKNRFTSLLHV
ncbi:MAG: Peptidase M16 domain protein [Candidatus Kaiserbacteria bacterium GW2011_GWA1_50_28]|nr:MAG: Peptidase M16 domain protein [Candidatus Kaiserbacteria bacterium GW2011_GWA1_50_28]